MASINVVVIVIIEAILVVAVVASSIAIRTAEYGIIEYVREELVQYQCICLLGSRKAKNSGHYDNGHQ